MQCLATVCRIGLSQGYFSMQNTNLMTPWVKILVKWPKKGPKGPKGALQGHPLAPIYVTRLLVNTQSFAIAHFSRCRL